MVLSLARMNKIRALDPLDFTMTVEAGCILQTIQEKARDAGCFFPLSLGAQGTCQIGGNISTNAGGVGVLRYGSTRALVLGLEVVLPDGTIWDGLRSLGKDNTGYDLRQFFIGAEGTLGIIAAAVLRLFPQPTDIQTALVALTDLETALPLLKRARATSSDQVTAFEVMPRMGIDYAATYLPGVTDPMDRPHAWYALVDLSTSRPGGAIRETMEALLSDAIEAGEAVDAVIANSIEQRKALWRFARNCPRRCAARARFCTTTCRCRPPMSPLSFAAPSRRSRRPIPAHGPCPSAISATAISISASASPRAATARPSTSPSMY